LIERVVRAVLAQRPAGAELEVIVVDDGSTDGTPALAAAAGARVLELQGGGGNPAAARNRGADASSGDPIVFLDADCVPGEGWLAALLAAHARGAAVVGGALIVVGLLHYRDTEPQGEIYWVVLGLLVLAGSGVVHWWVLRETRRQTA